MSKFLIRKLIAPLVVAAAVSVTLAFFVSWQGLFINLATTFLGSLITVVYIDRVIREHEKELWAKVETRILQRYARLANVVISQFRDILHIDHELFDFSGFPTRDLQQVQLGFADAVESKLPALLPICLARLDQTGWSKLLTAFQSQIDEGDKLIGLYGDKLDAQQMQSVLDLQDHLSFVIASHSMFPELFGASDAELSQSRIVDAAAWRDTGITLCADRLGLVARLCAQMMRATTSLK